MTRSILLEEARLVSMTDDELIDLIGKTWEYIKRIDEAMKADAEIERMVNELKQYKDERYLDEKKAFALKLKAARALAKARNLRFTLPARAEAADD